jgi:hypothetical protein
MRVARRAGSQAAAITTATSSPAERTLKPIRMDLPQRDVHIERRWCVERGLAHVLDDPDNFHRSRAARIVVDEDVAADGVGREKPVGHRGADERHGRRVGSIGFRERPPIEEPRADHGRIGWRNHPEIHIRNVAVVCRRCANDAERYGEEKSTQWRDGREMQTAGRGT